MNVNLRQAAVATAAANPLPTALNAVVTTPWIDLGTGIQLVRIQPKNTGIANSFTLIASSLIM